MRSPEIRHDEARERAELEAYLGEAFDVTRLEQHRDQLEDEFRATEDEDRFYRTSHGYLYDLTAFAMSGVKLPYLRRIAATAPPGARLLDYGCGIGSDGLILLEAGYRVEFADFDNPSVEYLRWRLRRRGHEAAIHDLDRGVPGGFELAYSFDVIEHVPDPYALLGELERRAQLVAVNVLEPVPDEPELHRDLPVGGLLAHAAERRLISHRIFWERSHLLVYEAKPASLPGRLRGRATIAATRAKRRLAHFRRRLSRLPRQ